LRDVEGNPERERLFQARTGIADWRRWGPYLSERQWGTVREDYSAEQTAWDSFPFDQARLRAYRWGEDGIAGISDDRQYLCFAFAFWNGADPFLKERYFGLNNAEGNHGEDVKEYYFYLDNLPTHAYMKALYKYPQREFPYRLLREENARRSRREPEFELIDTGIFERDEYYDIFFEYAKGSPDDILIRLTAINRGPQTQTLHVLPTLWFRNMWSWTDTRMHPKTPSIELAAPGAESPAFHAKDRKLGDRYLYYQPGAMPLFTENDTNYEALWGVPNREPFTKDAFDAFVVRGRHDAVNPANNGTKAAAYYRMQLEPGQSQTIAMRMTDARDDDALGKGFDGIFERRIADADRFYAGFTTGKTPGELCAVQRQAFAGMLWSKQLYRYSVFEWLSGDPAGPMPPESRWKGRNHEWLHLYNHDVISMPDKWEYPWYASWDLGFHATTFALIDPDFAKNQLELLTMEWYMHPNGQIPAYEWGLSDVNPPVLAFAALRVYNVERRLYGTTDRDFLKRIFKKLALNFTWWVNRKDAEGNNVFQGGFLGLDNIGAIDRGDLPPGYRLDQSDGTSWMAMFCATMMEIAGELAEKDPTYLDMFAKFLTHFIYIYSAIHSYGGGLWCEEDGFYYDYMQFPNGERQPMRIRSVVGLVPLFAIIVGEQDGTGPLLRVRDRLIWTLDRRPDLGDFAKTFEVVGPANRQMAAVVDSKRLECILKRLLDEDEFLSPYGIRALSKVHRDHPFLLSSDGMALRVGYEPAESETELFGSNSNWRGPIWFPINYLIIRSLRMYHQYLGDEFTVECPTRSGRRMSLNEVADELRSRLVSIFTQDGGGRRPFAGGNRKMQEDPHWREYAFFYEYFHGDTGAGLGASHQTGWTGLVANLIAEMESTDLKAPPNPRFDDRNA
jgi:hypothetical protein